MFVIAKLQDDVRVPAAELGKARYVAVSRVIEELYFNKVIPDVGLAITLYDILSVEGGTIHPREGAATYQVVFRLVVFRPTEGEIIIGKLSKANREGIQISLGFFEDVLVPHHHLQTDSMYDTDQQVWFWEFDGQRMYMDIGETVRFRVQEVTFPRQPTPMELHEARERRDAGQVGTADNPYRPMKVVADMCGDGLGPTSWWVQAEVEDVDEEAEGMENGVA